MKKITNIFYIIVLVFLIIVAGATAISAFNFGKGYHIFVVQTGSMEPTIKTGSLVVVAPSFEYKVNDVITFKVDKHANIRNPNLMVTHRVIDKEESNGTELYTTKGDANNTPDAEKISKDLVLGKVSFTIPYLGYPVGFAKTQTGFILLIVIPATLIVYSELINIKNETQRLLGERRKRNLTLEEKVKVAVGEEEVALEKGVKGFLRKLKG